MRHPLLNARDVEEISNYPFPDFDETCMANQRNEVEQIHAQGLAAVGNMQCTVWETAWYLRSMEELMIDMMTDDAKAELLLNKVTETSELRAKSFAKAGVDILFLGDDIGMQRSILMGEELYVTWLKSRLKKISIQLKQSTGILSSFTIPVVL
jgi:uroporphyrinogen decarboxylase